MSLFEAPDGRAPSSPPTPPPSTTPPPGTTPQPSTNSPPGTTPQPSGSARRTSRILFLVSAALAFAFLGTFYLDDLPLPMRTWVAETIPGTRDLVGIPPDPDAEVAALADSMFLTPEGRALFYQTRPRVSDVDEIAEVCADGKVLPDDLYHAGCYLGSDRIFILREAGPGATMVTTAAHELLHAVYRRLGDGERARIDALVTAEMARIPAGDPIHAQVEASVGDSRTAWPDERFAYLGTQIATPFDADLEAFYARYFTDRRALAALYRN